MKLLLPAYFAVCTLRHILLTENTMCVHAGSVVYAGVDYQAILDEAEQEADVVLWDGGNNDLPFYTPDLWIVVTDPHRAGHESSYYPGDVNFRCADVIVINKANTAEQVGTAQDTRYHAGWELNFLVYMPVQGVQ